MLGDAGVQLVLAQGRALGGAVQGLGGGGLVVEHLVDGVSVGVGLVFDAQALAVPAVGKLDLGLAALSELAQAQLAGYFHRWAR